VAFGDKSTYFYKQSEVEQHWYVVDAQGQTLGRLAAQVASVLRGKHKPLFTPNIDAGDLVIVINAEKVVLTGKRPELKEYYHNTQYPGGAVFESFKDVIKNHPDRVISHAVKGMLPHNRLGRRIIKKLKIYAGDVHPHEAQRPTAMKIGK
jgi:large subunit ribosomal protein L13